MKKAFRTVVPSAPAKHIMNKCKYHNNPQQSHHEGRTKTLAQKDAQNTCPLKTRRKSEAVIKSAACTASPKTKARTSKSGERLGDGPAGRGQPRGAPLGLVFLVSVFGEVALAANLITA